MDNKEYWLSKISVKKAVLENGSIRFHLIDENYDFIKYAKEFIDVICARDGANTSQNTLQTYCYNLRHFFVYLYIYNYSVLDTDGKTDVIIDYKLWLQNPYRFYPNIIPFSYNMESKQSEDELSISTQNQYISTVNTFYVYLAQSGIIKRNPMPYRNAYLSGNYKDRDMLIHTKRERRIKVNALISKQPKKKVSVISNSDFKTLLNSVKSLRDKTILLLLKEGGLRAGELLGVHIEDIDFGECGIWVKFRNNNSNGSRAKAGYGRDRFVFLMPSLMSLIDEYITSEWIKADPLEDYLYIVINSNKTDENGKPMKNYTLNAIFNYYGKKCIIDVHSHMLRHTHATELAQTYIKNKEPINWKFISERLGHRSITTTIDIYAHLETEDYKQEYERLYLND